MFDFLLFLQAVWTLVCCEKEILRLGKHGTRSFPKCWSTWKIWQLVMKRPLEYLWRAAMVVWVVWVRVLSQHEKIPRSRNSAASQNGWSLLQEGRSKARPAAAPGALRTPSWTLLTAPPPRSTHEETGPQSIGWLGTETLTSSSHSAGPQQLLPDLHLRPAGVWCHSK